MDALRTNDLSFGIIFDDMTFTHIADNHQIHLVDMDNDRDIHCRYTCVKIPAHTPKIITSNAPIEQILRISNPAIARRVTVINVIGIGNYVPIKVFDHIPETVEIVQNNTPPDLDFGDDVVEAVGLINTLISDEEVGEEEEDEYSNEHRDESL